MSDDAERELYPAYRFHPTRGMTRVETRVDDDALKQGDAGWVNTPQDLEKKTAPAPPALKVSPYAGYQTAAPDEAPPDPAPAPAVRTPPPPEPAPDQPSHPPALDPDPEPASPQQKRSHKKKAA